MNLILDADEKYAYNESISNFIVIKVWNDLGIDVSKFSDFIAEPGGYGNSSSEIFEDGLKSLFSEVQCLTPYEDDEFEQVSSECGLNNTPETLFLFSNEKVKWLMETGEIEKLKGTLTSQQGDLVEFEMGFHEKYGILLALYFDGLLFEAAMSVAEIYKQIDCLYKKPLEGDSHGFYLQAV